MWKVKVGKQLVHCSNDFRLAYKFAKLFKGTLTYKPYEASCPHLN